MYKLLLINGAQWGDMVQHGAIWCMISPCFLFTPIGQQISKLGNRWATKIAKKGKVGNK
jgi:hypothetical protein